MFRSIRKTRCSQACLASLLLATLLSTACATSIRPLEQREIAKLEARGFEAPREMKKNKWIAGALGIAAPACNLYLAWGTERREQLTMSLINAATWPFSVVWAIPSCVLDTDRVNALTGLRQYVDSEA